MAILTRQSTKKKAAPRITVAEKKVKQMVSVVSALSTSDSILATLSLEKYEPQLRGISFDDMISLRDPRLWNDIFKEAGILHLGDRLKMMNYLKKMSEGSTSNSNGRQPPRTRKSEAPSAASAAAPVASEPIEGKIEAPQALESKSIRHINTVAMAYEECSSNGQKVDTKEVVSWCQYLRLYKTFFSMRDLFFLADHQRFFKVSMVHALEPGHLKQHILTYLEMWSIVAALLSTLIVTLWELTIQENEGSNYSHVHNLVNILSLTNAVIGTILMVVSFILCSSVPLKHFKAYVLSILKLLQLGEYLVIACIYPLFVSMFMLAYVQLPMNFWVPGVVYFFVVFIWLAIAVTGAAQLAVRSGFMLANAHLPTDRALTKANFQSLIQDTLQMKNLQTFCAAAEKFQPISKFDEQPDSDSEDDWGGGGMLGVGTHDDLSSEDEVETPWSVAAKKRGEGRRRHGHSHSHGGRKLNRGGAAKEGGEGHSHGSIGRKLNREGSLEFVSPTGFDNAHISFQVPPLPSSPSNNRIAAAPLHVPSESVIKSQLPPPKKDGDLRAMLSH